MQRIAQQADGVEVVVAAQHADVAALEYFDAIAAAVFRCPAGQFRVCNGLIEAKRAGFACDHAPGDRDVLAAAEHAAGFNIERGANLLCERARAVHVMQRQQYQESVARQPAGDRANRCEAAANHESRVCDHTIA